MCVKSIGQELQEGPRGAGESPKIREMRGHVQSDLFERRLCPAQLEAAILRQTYLRE